MFCKRSGRPAGKVKFETLIIILLLLGWFLLQAVVMPKLGVST